MLIHAWEIMSAGLDNRGNDSIEIAVDVLATEDIIVWHAMGFKVPVN